MIQNILFKETLVTETFRSYNTATPSDLWNGLQVALDTYNGTVNIPENESVESILNTWQSQAGYPVINIDRNYITGSINVSQVSISWLKLYSLSHTDYRVDSC